MNDKDNTFIFKPEREEKPHIDRTGNDAYSSARRVRYRKEEEKTSPLIYVVIGLSVVLIITIILGLIILTSDRNNNNNGDINKQPPVEIVDDENTEEDEPELVINFYGLIFNYDRIFLLESGNGYGVSADLYESGTQKVGTRVVRITDETEIRDNGKRISMDAFISVIRNQGGDMILFDSQVREEDNVVLLITYDSRGFEEEIPQEPEKPEPPAEIPEDTNNPNEEAPEDIAGEVVS